VCIVAGYGLGPAYRSSFGASLAVVSLFHQPQACRRRGARELALARPRHGAADLDPAYFDFSGRTLVLAALAGSRGPMMPAPSLKRFMFAHGHSPGAAIKPPATRSRRWRRAAQGARRDRGWRGSGSGCSSRVLVLGQFERPRTYGEESKNPK